jgi:hypothetical protein
MGVFYLEVCLQLAAQVMCANQASIPIMHGGMLTSRASIWPRDRFSAARPRRADRARRRGTNSCRYRYPSWLADSQRHSLVRQEHGRAIPLLDLADHSALMPDALMIGHHFFASAFCKAASASGVCCSRGKT